MRGIKDIKYFVALSMIAEVLLLYSCKRKEPIDEGVIVGDKFGTVLLINGTAKTINVDQGNYYMYSGYDTDSGIIRFKGSLREENCVECKNVLEINISNYTTGSYNIEQALTKKQYEYAYRNGTDKYRLRFYGNNPIAGATYSWAFSDTGGQGATLGQVVDHIFARNGTYEITMTESRAQCTRSSSQVVSVGIPELPCKTRIEAIRDDTGQRVIFIAKTVGAASSTFKYLWDFGDGETRETLLLQNEKKYAAPGDYTVRLTTIDLNSTCEDTTTTYFLNYLSDCSGNFHWSLEDVLTYTPLSKASIRYVDDHGTEYLSATHEQDPSGMFVVKDVSEYRLNERGEKTKKISCTFKVRLYDANGNFIDVESPETVFSVAYP